MKNPEVVLFLGFIMVMGGVMSFRRKDFFRLDFGSPFMKLETKRRQL